MGSTLLIDSYNALHVKKSHTKEQAMATQEKFALITGAGSGIGKSIALALAGAGYSVALAGRRQEPLEETAKQAQVHGVRALVVPTDISDPIAVDHLFEQITEHFGRLDLLFNNAGIFARAVSLEELEYEQRSEEHTSELQSLMRISYA